MADNIPFYSHPSDNKISRSTSGRVNSERDIAVPVRKGPSLLREPRDGDKAQHETPTVTLHGVVDKIVAGVGTIESEQAQIVIQGAHDLYREIRVDTNLFLNGALKVKLKPGTKVIVTIAVESGTGA